MNVSLLALPLFPRHLRRESVTTFTDAVICPVTQLGDHTKIKKNYLTQNFSVFLKAVNFLPDLAQQLTVLRGFSPR